MLLDQEWGQGLPVLLRLPHLQMAPVSEPLLYLRCWNDEWDLLFGKAVSSCVCVWGGHLRDVSKNGDASWALTDGGCWGSL